MKTILALLLLFPLILFSEEFQKRFGLWTELIYIDDFTDKKSITVFTPTENDYFAVRWQEGNIFDFAFEINSDKKCKKYHEASTTVLFRVDKNELFEMQMIKQPGEEFENYMIDFNNWIAVGEGTADVETKISYLKYLNELKKGKILRIRVSDSNIDCYKDLAIDLENFDKAIKNLYDENSNIINSAEISDFLNESIE